MTSTAYVRFVRDADGRQPRQAYHDDAGWDLSIVEEVTLQPGESQDIRTGVRAAFPDGHWGLVMARSSMVRKFKVHVTPAVIDAGFRGELRVLATNFGDQPVSFAPGDRLAQIILVPVPRVEWVEQMTLPSGTREHRGFGSSGLGEYRHVGSAPEECRGAVVALAAVEACGLLSEEQLREIFIAPKDGVREALVRAFTQLRGL
jgi:dUTP pyrophosphatase